MNRLRLVEACPKDEFGELTGLEWRTVERAIAKGTTLQLLTETDTCIQVTDHGRRYLNSLLELFV